MDSTPIVRRLLPVLAFAFFYAVNPAYLSGCGSEESEEFTFGEQDMLDLLADANGQVHEATDDDGRGVELELELDQVAGEDSGELAAAGSPSWMMRASACGSRSFLASASACDVATHMPLEGTITLRITDGDDTQVLEDLAVEGVLMVNGHDLDNAYLELDVLDGEGFLSLHGDGAGSFELVGVELGELPGEALTLSITR